MTTHRKHHFNLSNNGEIFWGSIWKLRTRKRKRNFCVVFTYSIKRAREIRKFRAAVVKRRLRNLFKVDRLQIILVAKKYISTRRNCSSVGCLKCVQFHNWFRLHYILYQLQNILGGATHHVRQRGMRHVQSCCSAVACSPLLLPSLSVKLPNKCDPQILLLW